MKNNDRILAHASKKSKADNGATVINWKMGYGVQNGVVSIGGSKIDIYAKLICVVYYGNILAKRENNEY